MADELFGDLLGPTPGSSVTGKPSALAPAVSRKTGFAKILPVNGAEEEGTSAGPAPGVTEANSATVTLTAEELSALVEKGIHAALDSTFTKFVRSLRTVLEDMTRRISSQEATVVELRAAVCDLREVVASQPSDLHVRFTNLDMAIKEVERGVQALRDRQELQEAQELLARMSSETSRVKGHTTTAPGSAAAASSAVTTPPAEAPAAAPLARAPSPSPVISPFPAAVAPPAPAASAVPPASPAPVPAVAAPVAPQAAAAAPPMPAPAAAPPMPAPQQAPYGMQLHAPLAQPAAVPTHMPSGYPVVGLMGMPGAPPLPISQQPSAEPQQQAPQQQQQQQHIPAPQYHYQPQPQVGGMQPGGGMPPTADVGPYGAMQQQPMHAPQTYPPLYGAMPGMDAPRAPSMPSPHTMPSQPTPPPPGGPSAGAPGPPLDMRGGPPPPMVSYPPPPSGIHAYPQPSSIPTVSVPSMYPRATAPAPGYRGSAQSSSSGGGGGGPTGSRTVPLDKIIADITQMGFNRSDVLAAVNNLQSSGKALDLNTIIDKLTRG